MSNDQRYADLSRRSRTAGQDHLLHFWPELDYSQRRELLDDLERIDFAVVPALIEQYVRGRPPPVRLERLEPAPRIPAADRFNPDAETRAGLARGEELLRAGRVAAMVVAGGQGTRLGYDGPKGCLPVTPVRNKPLFQLFAEQLLVAGRRFGRPVRWYIMTSPTNDAETRDFFRSRRFFGLDAQQVIFFQQGVMPAFAPDGRILLDQKHRVALAPDGHGGSLLAMASRGVLADMAARGIDCISYFQVDNPLVHCVDPLFIGLHDLHASEMSSKCVPKADDRERVGNFVLAGGRLHVIEYSDLPDDLAEARNADGSRRFDAASPAIHVLSRRFIERLTADPARFALPWHRAEKKVACVNLASGRRTEPDEPNGVKLEAFIFDALPLAERTLLLETRREEEFSPVKNATGEDSLETSRRDQVRRAARWLEQAGVRVPRGTDGEPAVPIEISPLRAREAGDLRDGELPSADAFRGPAYLE